jgi:hypothetical protein
MLKSPYALILIPRACEHQIVVRAHCQRPAAQKVAADAPRLEGRRGLRPCGARSARSRAMIGLLARAAQPGCSSEPSRGPRLSFWIWSHTSARATMIALERVHCPAAVRRHHLLVLSQIALARRLRPLPGVAGRALMRGYGAAGTARLRRHIRAHRSCTGPRAPTRSVERIRRQDRCRCDIRASARLR